MFFFFRVFFGHVLLITGDTVFIRGPFPQIDQSASLGAKRPGLLPFPLGFYFTDRADMFLFFVFHVKSVVSPRPTSYSPLPLHFNTYFIGISTHPFT